MFQISTIKGNIYLEDDCIYKGIYSIDPCFIDGLVGKMTLMGIDILICITESEVIGKVKRIKKVMVIPLNANISTHLALFPKSKIVIKEEAPSKSPRTKEVPIPKAAPPDRKKSLFDIASAILNTMQPTFIAGMQSATKIIRDTNRMVNDLTFDDVINSICDLFQNGTFYYSDEYDLFDDKSCFFFNSLVFTNLGDLDVFGKRLLQGFVAFKSFKIEDTEFEFVLLSRRSRYRNGLRYEKRGIDELGYVANFVESVQKLTSVINKQQHLFKYSQIRGSVPLFWMQEAGMKPIPKLKEIPSVEQQAAMTVHLEKLKSVYHNITLLSLVELQGKEGILGLFFQEVYNQLQPEIRENTKLISWDFHAHCPGTNYAAVQELINQLKEIISATQYHWSTVSFNNSDVQDLTASTHSPTISDVPNTQDALLKEQRGIIRTNCMDCLDRTNLLQSQIAWVVLVNQMMKLGIQLEESKEIQQFFRHLWADNGNNISQCYAGTNAMKGDFTRNGQRDITGFAKDASSSVQRLYLNYVRDGYTQKLLDVLQGIEESDVLFSSK